MKPTRVLQGDRVGEARCGAAVSAADQGFELAVR